MSFIYILITGHNNLFHLCQILFHLHVDGRSITHFHILSFHPHKWKNQRTFPVFRNSNLILTIGIRGHTCCCSLDQQRRTRKWISGQIRDHTRYVLQILFVHFRVFQFKYNRVSINCVREFRVFQTLIHYLLNSRILERHVSLFKGGQLRIAIHEIISWNTFDLADYILQSCILQAER